MKDKVDRFDKVIKPGTMVQLLRWSGLVNAVVTKINPVSVVFLHLSKHGSTGNVSRYSFRKNADQIRCDCAILSDEQIHTVLKTIPEYGAEIQKCLTN